MIYNNLAIYEGIRKCLMSCQQGGTGEQRYRSNSLQYLIGESIPWILPTKLRPRDYQLLARPATTGRVTPELEMVAVTTVIFITVWQVPPIVLDRHILGTAVSCRLPTHDKHFDRGHAISASMSEPWFNNAIPNHEHSEGNCISCNVKLPNGGTAFLTFEVIVCLDTCLELEAAGGTGKNNQHLCEYLVDVCSSRHLRSRHFATRCLISSRVALAHQGAPVEHLAVTSRQ
jgi:hypothetical protein